MSTVIRSTITVRASSDRAFDLFVKDIETWWRRDTPYWMDPGHAIAMRFEPRLGGRLMEVRDAAGNGLVIGRITAYERGRRLAFTWRLPMWHPDADSDVEVIFDEIPGGTRVALRQDFGRALTPLGDGRDYLGAWRALLSFYAEHVGG